MKKIFLFISLFLSALCYGQSGKIVFSPVQFATTRSLPANSYSANVITGTNNADTLWVDGFKVSVGDRVLVNNEATAANIGIYVLTQQATSSLPFILKRADYSSTAPNLITSSQVAVQYGKIYAGYVFNLQTQGGLIIGTTGLGYASNKTYLDKGYPLTTGFVVVGTSIEAGYCPTCPGSVTKSWPDYLAGMFGITSYNNYAVASTGPRRACYALGLNIGAQKNTALLSGASFNYVRLPISGDTSHRFGMVKSAYRRLAALQFTNSIQFYRQGSSSAINANITTSGSAATALVIDTLKDFCSATVYYQLNDPANNTMNVFYRPSATTNETLQIINVPGATLGIGVAGFSLSAPASRIQITVDGSIVTTYDPNDRALDLDLENAFFHRLGFVPDEIIVTGLRDTLHTVILTYLDGGKIAYFDHIASLKTPNVAVTAPFYILDNVYMTSTGYNANGAQAATLDSASNSLRADMASSLPGYPIHYFNANYPSGLYQPTSSTNSQPDGIHPWQLGPFNIASSAENSIDLKISPAPTIDQALKNNNSSSQPLNLTGYYANGHNASFGDLTIRNGGLNNVSLLDNIDVINGVRSYIHTGFGEGFLLFSGGVFGSAYNTGTAGAGANGNLQTPFGFMYDGTAGFGGNMTSDGNYTGAIIKWKSSVLSFAASPTPGTTATYDLGTTSLRWNNVYAVNSLSTGAESNGFVTVSGTGTYSALGTDRTIEFTGTTATLAYPTVNLVNGRTLEIVNYGSGSLTIPSTKSGNAATITALTTNQRALVSYDLTNTTWVLKSLN